METVYFSVLKKNWCLLVVSFLSVGVLSCSSSQAPTYREPIPERLIPEEHRQVGSLFSSQSSGAFLYDDPRAHMVGDLITVVVDETSSVSGSSSTQLGRESGYEAGLGAFFGLMELLDGAIDPMDRQKLLEASLKADFKGSGKIKRQGNFSATMTGRVIERLQNGNLRIEGYKILGVNQEQWFFYFSGVVRQIDIDDANTVKSSRIAALHVEFTGKGDVSDTEHRGWLGQGVDKVWPF